MNLLARFLQATTQKSGNSASTQTTHVLPSSSRKRKRSVDEDSSLQYDNTRKRVSLRAAESPIPTTPPEDLPDPDDNFGDHHWQSLIVSQLVAASTQTISLISERGTRKYFVHKELLTYYSPYYRSILNPSIPASPDEATFGKGERCLIAKTTQPALALFTKWLYTRDLTPPETLLGLNISHLSAAPSLRDSVRSNADSSSDRKTDLLHLFVFATLIDSLALRRDILTALHHEHSQWIPTYQLLEHLYKHLPSDSPALKFLISSHVQHWAPEMDTLEVRRTRAFHAPAEFLFGVIEGQAVRIRSLGGCEQFDGVIEGGGESNAQAACCGDICVFHEHESQEEKVASCGSGFTLGDKFDIVEDDTELDSDDGRETLLQ